MINFAIPRTVAYQWNSVELWGSTRQLLQYSRIRIIAQESVVSLRLIMHYFGAHPMEAHTRLMYVFSESMSSIKELTRICRLT